MVASGVGSSNAQQYASPKVIISFHIGTIYSRISYKIDGADSNGEICSVHIEDASPNIHSIIFYDQKGSRCSGPRREEPVGDEELGLFHEHYTARCFKLHLFNPSTSRTPWSPYLPPGKSAVDIFTDFLQYLNECAKNYLSHRHGITLCQSKTTYILTYPTASARDILEKAALNAQLVPDSPAGRKLLYLVEEIEAAASQILGFPVPDQDDAGQAEEDGPLTLVIKAGGGIISVGTFQPKQDQGRSSIEASTISESHLEGAVFVTERARTYIQELLEHSHFCHSVENVVETFDRKTRLNFRSLKGSQHLAVGVLADEDAERDILYGHLILSGSTVARFFEPVVSCIVRAVLKQITLLGQRRISSAGLFGGMFRNDWLFARVRVTLEALGLDCWRLSRYSDTVVSHGAIQWYLHKGQIVEPSRRVSNYHYGVQSEVVYDSSNLAHARRRGEVFRNPDGRYVLRNAFIVLVPKGEMVTETREYRHTFSVPRRKWSNLSSINARILKHHDADSTGCPAWATSFSAGFETVQILEANPCASQLPAQTSPWKRSGKASYYSLDYDIIIRFGPDEFTAQLVWYEGGAQRVTLLYSIHD